MRKLFFLITLLLSIMTFSQSKKEKVDELIYLSGTFKVAKSVENEIFSIYRNKYKTVPEEMWQSYEEKISIDDLIDEAVSIFSNHFSAIEIDELYTFYKTDLGKKVFQNYPIISQDIQTAANNWVLNFSTVVDSDLENKGFKKKEKYNRNLPSPKKLNHK